MNYLDVIFTEVVIWYVSLLLKHRRLQVKILPL